VIDVGGRKGFWIALYGERVEDVAEGVKGAELSLVEFLS
jgi:hypothetical protein